MEVGVDMGVYVDLGDEHALRWVEWQPDLRLNPQYIGLPLLAYNEHFGAIVVHIRPNGTKCQGSIIFNTARFRAGREKNPGWRDVTWDVESWNPLTISPSLLCCAPVFDARGAKVAECSDHGFIRNGRWERA